MMRYTATIRHPSIAHAREIACGTNLKKATQLANRAFGDGFQDHEIVIFEQREDCLPMVRATRKISAKRWNYNYY